MSSQQEDLQNSYQVNVMSDAENQKMPEQSDEGLFFGDQENEQLSRHSQESIEPFFEHNQEEDTAHKSGEDIISDKDHKESFSAQFVAFKVTFDEQPSLEAKLQLAIDFMEASLAMGNTPHFRSFWEVRRLCLPLFRENISSALRGQLWAKYSELSKEARRLKDILDEQSAFAVEQIEIAVKALENDIAQFDALVEQAAIAEDVVLPQSLKENQATYFHLQKQLNILNLLASRINALRKELLKTEMRVKFKNKFFHRLSIAGDHVFPKRKELIKEISQQFIHDVDAFCSMHFESRGSRESFHLLRDEIKALQAIAKILTLNTHSFTLTRTKLSSGWDQIKVEEKERKKERVQQKAVYQQNAEEVMQHIHSLKDQLSKNAITPIDALNQCENISRGMRKVELGRDEVKSLREALTEIKDSVNQLVNASQHIRAQEEKARLQEKRAKVNALKEMIEELLGHVAQRNAEELVARRETIISDIHDSSLTKSEKIELERLLKPLKDVIAEKHEEALLELSEDDRQSLQQLKTILQQRKERRQEIKNQLEIFRKAAGSSGLDFEKAMSYTALINEEKERLDKINQGIVEIEEKIVQLQLKIRSGK